MKNKTTTQAALAKKLGVSRQLISAHVLSGKAPRISDEKGWTVFLASLGRTGSMPTDQRLELAVERVRIARVTADRLELEHKVRLGTVMDLELVKRYASEAENYYHGETERLEREAPVLLAGLDKYGIRDALGKFLKDLRQRSREYFAKAGGAE